MGILVLYVSLKHGKLNGEFIRYDLSSALQDVEKCKQPACMREPNVQDMESLLGAVVLALLSRTCYQHSVRNTSRKMLLFIYTFIMRLNMIFFWTFFSIIKGAQKPKGHKHWIWYNLSDLIRTHKNLAKYYSHHLHSKALHLNIYNTWPLNMSQLKSLNIRI